jgi:aryl-alcohol dehydrogenase-like predicted oxidoreductase
MEKRSLGNQGPELTTIGLGAWAIGGPWKFGWGPQDDQASVDTIRSILDLGINWLDTAAVYGMGHSEEIVGKAIKGIRDQLFIATKCGLRWDEQGDVSRILDPKSIRKEIEDSLRRLDIDVIDLYQFHWPDTDTPIEDSWEVMLRLKEEGKIRYLGLSNHDVPLMKRAMKLAHVDSLQPPYNMISREIEAEILPFCREMGIGVIVYSPMASGLLSGRFDPNRLANDDWRKNHPNFTEPKLSKHLKLVEQLQDIANSHNATVGQIAIAWTLHHPAVTAAIVGARTPKQIQETSKAASITLTEEDKNSIEVYLKNLN